jgi:hypothetical protein
MTEIVPLFWFGTYANGAAAAGSATAISAVATNAASGEAGFREGIGTRISMVFE